MFSCAQTPTEQSTVVVSGKPVDFTIAAAKTINSVVHIRTEMLQKSTVWDLFYLDPFFDFFQKQPSMTYQSYGSGVILSKDGYIVTNNHVVEGAVKIIVTLNDKREYEAVTIGTDAKNDLALLKIDADDDIFPIQYGNSDNVKIGEWVLAVGNPYNLTSTVTAGIVSAKARNLNLLGNNTSISTFIQTDAAVNSGNSGGALVNVNGELIGINAAIASNTGSYAGYSFAIPVNIVKKVVSDLEKYGRVQHVDMGAVFEEIRGEKAKELHLSNVKGLLASKVASKKAADLAGIKNGDILLSINGKEVNSSSELKEILEQHLPGDIINCKILRNNKNENIKLTLQNMLGTTSVIKKDDKIAAAKLGAKLAPISEQIKSRFRIRYGLQVTDIEAGALKTAGVKDSFVITSVNGMSVASEDDIENILFNVEGNILIEGFYPSNGYIYKYKVLI
jgi:Do/DeqQ family serine protease